ncbi:hypothetical protein FOZ63_027415 [Perkinsus olseni]|uniref:Uncharacterized protein n=1 Tax=Perkinsus olseni TaxID=32597 RepID=A0A7J6TLR5_PEROL|nr:hypothetical protein FOZ62_004130 [Perkinsus olseni]KAF4746188.1 hypothetical protein FOZ63_027415 [Perkinsus olseni]
MLSLTRQLSRTAVTGDRKAAGVGKEFLSGAKRKGTPLASVVRFVERKWAIQAQHYANSPGSSDADRAMYSMVSGQMLHTGYGCEKDEGKAYEYFSKAAALGHMDAKELLESKDDIKKPPNISCFE